MRRARALGLYDLVAYRAHLEAHGTEWDALAALCTVSISRFYRDRSVFDALADRVLPMLAEEARERGKDTVGAWSAGCASGEEVYTLLLVWRFVLLPGFPDVRLEILGTDRDPVLVDRARAACYRPSSLERLPENWRTAAFERLGEALCLREAYRPGASFACQDLRTGLPEGVFDMVLCRNLAFTYFAPAVALDALVRLVSRLRPGGALVLGLHEHLPEGDWGLAPWPGCRAVYRRAA